ncbi:DUF2812 domain-containing protein [Blautia schinkii]|nr:DUF2812 domain-containing protein [Blautia schinkii]
MKKIIHKVFTAWHFEDEEKWINKMAAKGLNLTDVGVAKYVFEEGLPGEYQYRVELLENLPTHPESERYIRFMEEMGAEYVASVSRWVYFRKKAEDEPFELYSDMDSRVAHLRRINILLVFLFIFEVWAGVFNLVVGIAYGMAINVIIACIPLILALCIIPGIIRSVRKYRRLKREREIRE